MQRHKIKTPRVEKFIMNWRRFRNSLKAITQNYTLNLPKLTENIQNLFKALDLPAIGIEQNKITTEEITEKEMY